MTEWPKNPDVRAPIDNSELLPIGPLNVFNEKLAHADAINHAHVVKRTYDQEHPQPQVKEPTPLPAVVATGQQAGVGHAVPYEAAKYMMDVAGTSARTMRRRR